jgi:proline iminopeptidase
LRADKGEAMKKLNRRNFLKLNAASIAGAAFSLPADAAFATSSGRRKPAKQNTDKKAAPTELKTGGVRMIEVDGKYRVWTKRIGAGQIKMLTLHGGPGFSHDYFECFEDFLPQQGIQFYYYDQLGSGNSDHPDDTNLWTVERFTAEVEQVRAALGLENFYLYGQSWGGMLGIEYALKYQQHLKGLILSNMTASINAYLKYINELREQLSPEIKQVLEKYESKGEFEAPEYQQVMFEQIYAKHLCRLNPLPEPVERAMRLLNAKVYNTMQGPNEFVVTGNFKSWDRWNDLKKIQIPTLLFGARYDTMSPADIKKMGTLIAKSRVAICENGSHLSMWDDQESYFNHLLKFVKDVERGIMK